MITSQGSYSTSLPLRLAVTVIISVSTLFVLIAIATNQWVIGNGELNIYEVGLWNACSLERCVAVSHIIYSKILFVIGFIFQLLANLGAVLGIVYGVDNMKKNIGQVMIAAGLLIVCAMIPATVYLVLGSFFKSVGYGLVFGWLGGILGILAAALSMYHHKIDPDSETPYFPRTTEQPPPSYSVDPPPSHITVP